MNALRLKQQTTVYQGRFLRVTKEVLECNGRRIVRETIRHPGSVVIVPLLDRSHIIFVRQYRRAVGRWLLELPAGTLDHQGERPSTCARRELEEETGWKAGRLTQIGWFFAAPGFLSERLTIFVATNLTHTTAHPEPDELVTPVVLSLRTALAKIHQGTICDAKSIIGVVFAQRFLA
ncbi:MAG: NUDIX hydrolase [Candidatus Omnitrophica bacterium]|nr:NUDIX hydrolase [Candidatus Omnitrophota bacterium]